jgi:serine/threonine protein phosphatase PrpC
MTMPIDWSPFDASNAIGDPGRQPEIRSASGLLNVGVPDTALDFVTADPLELRACSSRGWSHRYLGTPRQDSYSLLVKDEYVVIAVADGVSEGHYSQVAAETAARSACKLVADQVARVGTVDWLQIARRVSMRIIEEAEYRQIVATPGESATIEDRLRACRQKMSTTLIVAIVGRQATHAGLRVKLCVVAGDSAAYLVRDRGMSSVAGGKSTTYPITSTGVRPLPGTVEPEASSLFLGPGEALILGTDGIGDPIGDGDGEVGQELAARWVGPPTIDRFLRDVNVYRRSYDDDRTAIGVWVRPDVVPPEPEPELADAGGERALVAETGPATDGRDWSTGYVPDSVPAGERAPADPVPDGHFRTESTFPHVAPGPQASGSSLAPGAEGEPGADQAAEAVPPALPAAPPADPAGWRPTEYPRRQEP